MTSGRGSFDLVKAVHKYKGHVHKFSLDAKRWKALRTQPALKWKRLPFRVSSHTHVPKVRGIYAFCMEVTSSNLPEHGYIMYIGIAGVGNSSNLHTRFKQYLREPASKRPRPRVEYLLRNWKSALSFHFAEVSDPAVNLRLLETAFLDAILPPINGMDFSANIMKVKRAVF